jgi:hypothetical protein
VHAARFSCKSDLRMLDTPGWRALCADLQQIRAWEWEPRMNKVTGYPCDDGTYEFDCYSLYQSYSSGLPYVLADRRCYDFGGIGNAEKLMPGLIVELRSNEHYDVWTSLPWTGQTLRVPRSTLGFVYSCLFNERDDRWHAIISCTILHNGLRRNTGPLRLTPALLCILASSKTRHYKAAQRPTPQHGPFAPHACTPVHSS